jgi:hypothetical protein
MVGRAVTRREAVRLEPAAIDDINGSSLFASFRDVPELRSFLHEHASG